MINKDCIDLFVEQNQAVMQPVNVSLTASSAPQSAACLTEDLDKAK